ncbi:Nicotinamidase-related amidase [Blastococcus sp. DSM 46786]|uniref:isochorismatase family protein n=1 Tax=Blastococcus sp. DSM 46786 TaxID=1798227 RepID=UPI0008B711AB|nr:isochorismatase family protein [Blastococcus sp. DSM 46786]SEK91834.1 Nicotinamidase-related amidase [Blastococcus sp. DSM 46786]
MSAAADPGLFRGEERLDPERTVLCVFDLLEHYRAAAEAAGVVPTVRRLADGCRERGVVVAWARADHRADGLDLARSLSDLDGAHRAFGPGHPRPQRPPAGSGDAAYRTLAELGQRPEDVDVPKHRWSALEGTCLLPTMRARGADTLLLVGGSTHVGIAATAYAARDLDLQVVVVRDGLTGREPQRSFFADEVFPRICRVRSTDEVLAALDRPSPTTGAPA